MGMRQRKCPRCKKWRRYEESSNHWEVVDHVKICPWCSERIRKQDETSMAMKTNR